MITTGARDQERGLVAGSGAQSRGGEFDDTVAARIFRVPCIPSGGMRLEKLFKHGACRRVPRQSVSCCACSRCRKSAVSAARCTRTMSSGVSVGARQLPANAMVVASPTSIAMHRVVTFRIVTFRSNLIASLYAETRLRTASRRRR